MEFYVHNGEISAVTAVEYEPEGTIVRKNPEKVLKVGRYVKKTQHVPMGKSYAS
jgi:hypothetical protein